MPGSDGNKARSSGKLAHPLTVRNRRDFSLNSESSIVAEGWIEEWAFESRLDTHCYTFC
jgi:hypothetical protein